MSNKAKQLYIQSNSESHFLALLKKHLTQDREELEYYLMHFYNFSRGEANEILTLRPELDNFWEN